MANIEQNICDAIEVIANNIVSKAGFDKTIQATIISCVDELTGKYKVKYQDNTLYAYASNVDKKYSKGNRVYVLIPGNDMTRDKTILGTVGQESPYKSTEAGVVYRKVSTNLIELQNNNGYKIYSGTEYNLNEDNKFIAPFDRYGKVLYNSDGAYDIKLLEEDVIKEYVNNTDCFWLEATFEAVIPGAVKGNYGLRVSFLCGDENSTYLYNYYLDIGHGITGEFYNLFEPQSKYYIVPIPDNFIKIQRIELFAQDFATQLDNVIKTENLITDDLLDITVTNLGIYSAKTVDYSKINNGIDIISPRGIILLNRSSSSTLPIRAEVIEQGERMNGDSNQFYWFKKDASVNSIDHVGWHRFGGLGWRCLNAKDASGNWIAAADEFDFDETKHLTIYKNSFKVVSYRQQSETTAVQHEKEFLLFNNKRDKKDIKITITSNRLRNVVSRLVDDLQLTCDITPKDANATYQYYWNANSSNILWPSHQKMSEYFNCSFNNNIVSDIKLKKLNNLYKFITFNCTVIKTVDSVETVLGTESINFVVEEKILNPYTLEIVGGDQIFLYDENGVAPTKDGTLVPNPLSIRLFNNDEGEEVNLTEEIEKGNLTINWSYAEDPSLLYIKETSLTNSTSLEYTLKSPYSYENLDSNVITVTVNYDNLVLTQKTNFTFLTQGGSGTNGTEYAVRIIPNVGDINDIPRWVVFTADKNSYTDGVFNFKSPNLNENYFIDKDGCYDSRGGALLFPFKAELMKNGIPIYSDNINKILENDEGEVRINWSMNIKTYASGIKDKSNFEFGKINKNEDENNENEDENNENENVNNLTMRFKRKMYEDREYNKFTNTPKALERAPANIIKCEITYLPKEASVVMDDDGEQHKTSDINEKKGTKIYAYLPIVTIINDTDTNIEFDIDSGFNTVVYNRDGCRPQYDTTKNDFKIITSTPLNPSKCTWTIKGYSDVTIGDSKNSLNVTHFLIKDKMTTTRDTLTVIPVYSFMGESFTNAVLFTYNKEVFIHIPIDMHLNLFGLKMLNDWDGQSIEINEDGGYILAPQIGAGEKDSVTNTFTGIIMGQAKDTGQKDLHPGLYAYHNSQRTFSLMADKGICAIGKKGAAQIIIDPASDRGCIYSGNFFNTDNRDLWDESTGFIQTEVLDRLWDRYLNNVNNLTVKQDVLSGNGMLIDLTKGHIVFGNGNFQLDQNGRMICLKGHLANKIKRICDYDAERPSIVTNYDGDTENFFVDVAERTKEDYQKFSDKNKAKKLDYFLYCRPSNEKDPKQEKVSFYVRKTGEMFCNQGEIGGFTIDKNTLHAGKTSDATYNEKDVDGKTVKVNGKVVKRSAIALSNAPFKRKMKILSAELSNGKYISFGELQNYVPKEKQKETGTLNDIS